MFSSLQSSSSTIAIIIIVFAIIIIIRFVFAATANCEVIHGTIYSCLRAMFGLSVVGILVSIFSCMLVYQVKMAMRMIITTITTITIITTIATITTIIITIITTTSMRRTWASYSSASPVTG